MSIIIIGALGRIGRRLMAAFPGAVGIDRVPGADIVADLETIDFDDPEIRELFEKAEAVIHVATSASTVDPDEGHWRAVVGTARLMQACDLFNIRRVVLPSSDWADPQTRWADNAINTYGHSKRVIEAMAMMYNMQPGRKAVALRFGWVPNDVSEVAPAAQWLQANYWDDERLIGQVKGALGD